ncbi:MAG: TonB family protein [Acetobacter sp.]
MSKWHTDRHDPAGGEQALEPHAPTGRLVGIARQHALALGLSRQNGLVWMLAFALAIIAHMAMTVWLIMSVAPQTGTQQPAAVSMLFEAPRIPLPQTGQAQPDPQEQPPPPPEMKDMPDMDEQLVPQEETVVLPPSAILEAEHLPPASAVPKKLVVASPPMHHAQEPRANAKPVANAAQTGVEKTTGHTQAKTDRVATGGQSAAPASAAAAGQKGGFQLSCSAPEAHYPVSARHLHEEGEALAEVSINAKGQVIAARLVKSTGYEDLDDQALQTVKNLHCTAPEATVVTGRIPIGFHIQ